MLFPEKQKNIFMNILVHSLFTVSFMYQKFIKNIFCETTIFPTNT